MYFSNLVEHSTVNRSVNKSMKRLSIRRQYDPLQSKNDMDMDDHIKNVSESYDKF